MLVPRLDRTHAAPTVLPKAPAPLPASSQIYRWPALFDRLSWSGPLVGALLLFDGLYLASSSDTARDLSRMTGGLLLVLVGAVALAAVAGIHLCLAREVRFTRESIVVCQTARRELVLPYATYQEDWVADTSPHGSMRLLFFRHNRGCTVLDPPEWFECAIDEVARIQMEEGWYEPDEEAGAAAR